MSTFYFLFERNIKPINSVLENMQHFYPPASSLKQGCPEKGSGIRRDNTMKRKMMAVLLTATLLVSGFAGCSEKKDSGKTRRKNTKETESEVAFDDDEVVFITRGGNYAWCFSDSATFIMGNGDMYSYYNDLTLLPGTVDCDEKLAYLLEYTEPIGKIDTDYLEDLYKAAIKIDPNAEQISENIACDMGQRSVYLPTDDGNILLYSYGDNIVTLDDKNYDDFEDLWEEYTEHINTSPEYVYSIFKSELPIISFHCGYVDTEDSRIICRNYEEFMEAVEYWGLDANAFEEYNEPYLEDVPFLVQFNIVGSSGYMILHDAMLIKDYNQITFIPSEGNYSPSEDDTVCEVMDGFVTVSPYLGFCTPEELTEHGWVIFEK